MSRLTAVNLPHGVVLPDYIRAEKRIGIVHFGLGAFARAHLAWYTDRAMAADGGDWMIAGVSMRSGDVAAQLNPQDGLYTLAEKSGAEKSAAGTTRRVIGSIARVSVATNEGQAITDLIAAPSTHIISFTVTEKGYCRAADGGLDLAQAQRGFYPLLAAGFARRRAAGRGGLTLLSCDNLADNGRQLQRLMGEYLAAQAPDLAAWFAAECRCPGTMVDRIVPATTRADCTQTEIDIAIRDEGAIFTEPFSQWVIEDNFVGPRPAWDQVGADLVADVAPYETAKLRMLNGAHSALAYLGLERGHTFVHEAVADPALRPMIEALMLQEAAPTITPAPGQDLAAYADALLARFANSALQHRLIQIAMDGSQKIPQRWLATLAEAQKAGRECPVIQTELGAWLRHVRGDNAAEWGPVDDPRAAELSAAWAFYGETGIAQALFGAGGLMASGWAPAGVAISPIPIERTI